MKKIFTLAIGSLFALTVMAADHKPSVTVKSNSNYMIVVDGKKYIGDDFINLSSLFPGYHSIKVYDVNKHKLFRKKAKLVSSSDFTLRGNDIRISVDRFGKIDIDESRFDTDRDHNKGWDNKDYGKKDRGNGHKGRF
jgi:hypothetical protein